MAARIVMVAVLMVALVGLAAWAAAPEKGQRPDRPEKGQAMRPMHRPPPPLHGLHGLIAKLREMREELNLTPEQKEKVREILKAHKTEITAAVKNVREKRKAMNELVRAETPDPQAMRTAAQGLGTAIGDAAVLRAQIRGEVLAVLTPEQRQKLNAALEEMEKQVDEAVVELEE